MDQTYWLTKGDGFPAIPNALFRNKRLLASINDRYERMTSRAVAFRRCERRSEKIFPGGINEIFHSDQPILDMTYQWYVCVLGRLHTTPRPGRSVDALWNRL